MLLSKETSGSGSRRFEGCKEVAGLLVDMRGQDEGRMEIMKHAWIRTWVARVHRPPDFDVKRWPVKDS